LKEQGVFNMSPVGLKCSFCNASIRTNSNQKNGHRIFFVEESTFWNYSDGKRIPTVKFYRFCSPNCLVKWAETSESPSPPDDLNCWVDGRKISMVV